MAIKTNEREAWTSRPKTHRLRRRGAGWEACFTRCLLLPGEGAAAFEEVKLEDIPAEEDIAAAGEDADDGRAA